MTQKKIEQNALIVSTIVTFIFTGLGLWVFLKTNIHALFLDFFFSFIAMVSSGAAVIISKASKRRTKHYPNGLYFLEPLYAIFKSLLTLSLLISATIIAGETAFIYFFDGVGSPMYIVPVLPYTMIATVLCFGLGIYNHSQNKKINGISTMLKAEVKTNFIDGFQSLGIGLGVLALHVIPIDSTLGFFHYTGDFFITVIVAMISMKEPIKVLYSAFMELSGGTTNDKNLEQKVNAIVCKHFSKVRCNVYKIGMKLCIHVFSEADMETKLLPAKQSALTELAEQFDDIEIILCR